MNYFAHSRRFLESPYFIAGVSAPDWLSAVHRKSRLRSRNAIPFVDHADTSIANFARGVLQHLHDDDWFHSTRAFAELSLNFTVAIRDLLVNDDGMRPSFLGHILVELILDDVLIQEDPERLTDYYNRLGELDPATIGAVIDSIATRPAPKIPELLPRFIETRFLADYATDRLLWKRLNNVMTRVGLPQLPESLQQLFPDFRTAVSSRREELLDGEAEPLYAPR
ncbi:MAG: hypothetical protein NXI22_09445 [bacterium]|nr:hypothetical protein [bacterium]